MRRDSFNPVAQSVPFDNSTNGFSSSDVQAAIEEVKSLITAHASPGYTYGRSGTSSGGTYLLCDGGVPSNVAGRWTYLNNCFVQKVYISDETFTTYTVEATYHDGILINEVVLGSVTVNPGRGGEFTVNWLVPINKQLAVRIKANTANSPKNIVVGLQLSGTL